LRSSLERLERIASLSPYTIGFWSRTAIANAMRMPMSAAARATAFASSTSGIVPLGRV
jgi:hypothetical protein